MLNSEIADLLEELAKRGTYGCRWCELMTSRMHMSDCPVPRALEAAKKLRKADMSAYDMLMSGLAPVEREVDALRQALEFAASAIEDGRVIARELAKKEDGDAQGG